MSRGNDDFCVLWPSVQDGRVLKIPKFYEGLRKYVFSAAFSPLPPGLRTNPLQDLSRKEYPNEYNTLALRSHVLHCVVCGCCCWDTGLVCGVHCHTDTSYLYTSTRSQDPMIPTKQYVIELYNLYKLYGVILSLM